jgi:hypothetical protein
MGKKHAANPTDTFRKEQRKKEIKKNKTNRKLVRETGASTRTAGGCIQRSCALRRRLQAAQVVWGTSDHPKP